MKELEMVNSTHKVEVVHLDTIASHPNADRLQIIRLEGYQAIIKKGSFKEGDLAAYIQPDSLVLVDRPEFAFLKDPKKPDQTQVRIKARRLRGEWSMGLLIPAPVDAKVGDDIAEALGVTHYEPPEPNATTGGECEVAPRLVVLDDGETEMREYPNYDVEAFRKYGRVVFEQDEPVWVTEKIHGSNGRWLYDGERFHCGSHTKWKRADKNNLWWRAIVAYPALENFLFMNPGTAVYGEVYGQVQDLKYGTTKGEIRVAVFDILHEGRWVNAEDAYSFQPNPEGPPASTLPWVPILESDNGRISGPILNSGRFDFETLITLAEGPSLIEGAKHCREGIVIKPLRERWDPKCGRVCLKIVSNEYLSRAS